MFVSTSKSNEDNFHECKPVTGPHESWVPSDGRVLLGLGYPDTPEKQPIVYHEFPLFKLAVTWDPVRTIAMAALLSRKREVS